MTQHIKEIADFNKELRDMRNMIFTEKYMSPRFKNANFSDLPENKYEHGSCVTPNET